MGRFFYLLVGLIDRTLAPHGMALFYRPEWDASRRDAWHDTDGSFTLYAWRFEFIRDAGLRWPVRG